MPNDRVPRHKQRLATDNRQEWEKQVSSAPAPSNATKSAQNAQQRQNMPAAGDNKRELLNEGELG